MLAFRSSGWGCHAVADLAPCRLRDDARSEGIPPLRVALRNLARLRVMLLRTSRLSCDMRFGAHSMMRVLEQMTCNLTCNLQPNTGREILPPCGATSRPMHKLMHSITSTLIKLAGARQLAGQRQGTLLWATGLPANPVNGERYRLHKLIWRILEQGLAALDIPVSHSQRHQSAMRPWEVRPRKIIDMSESDPLTFALDMQAPTLWQGPPEADLLHKSRWKDFRPPTGAVIGRSQCKLRAGPPHSDKCKQQAGWATRRSPEFAEHTNPRWTESTTSMHYRFPTCQPSLVHCIPAVRTTSYPSKAGQRRG
jgi:hypothetical protein